MEEIEFFIQPNLLASLAGSGKCKDCELCGKTFWARMPHAKFCSAECRVARTQPKALGHDLRCEHCGKNFHAKMPQAKFCSIRCRVASDRAIVA